MNRAGLFFRGQFHVVFVFVLFVAGCAKEAEKRFQPVIARVPEGVRTLSFEEAETLCREHYCEENLVYSAHFGRRKPVLPSPPPIGGTPIDSPPAPTLPPSHYPAQPREHRDYFHGILKTSDAWKISRGSSEVLVAVIDSGVDYFHPDLVESIHRGASYLPGFDGDVYGWDFYHERPNAYDDNGHGTHCAGVIAAKENGIGVVGVAPGVKILPIKFLGKDGRGDTADAIRAIDYAVSRGARVISNSWGGPGYSKLLDEAIQRAIQKGVVVVAAAGNEGSDNDRFQNYPAGYDGVISVGASDSSDFRSSFSNHGAVSVDVFAPGASILSTYPGGRYHTLSGTSMAAPQVAGTIALGISLSPSIAPREITDDLCSTTVSRLLQDSRCGRIDALAFLRRILERSAQSWE